MVGCTIESCPTNRYTNDGKCCAYVCEIGCEHGFVEGTCNCECADYIPEDDGDLGIDDIFDDDDDIQPPPMIPQ